MPGFTGSDLADGAYQVVTSVLVNRGEFMAGVRAETLVSDLYRGRAVLVERERLRSHHLYLEREARGYSDEEYVRAGVLVRAVVSDLAARGGVLDDFDTAEVEHEAFERVARDLHTFGLERANVRAMVTVRNQYLAERGPRAITELQTPTAVWTVPRIRDEAASVPDPGRVRTAAAESIVDAVLQPRRLRQSGVRDEVIRLVAPHVDPEFFELLHRNHAAIALAASIGRDLGIERSQGAWQAERSPGAAEREGTPPPDGAEGPSVTGSPGAAGDEGAPTAGEADDTYAAAVMQAAVDTGEDLVLRGGFGRVVRWRGVLQWVGPVVSPEFLAELSASVTREVIAIAVGPGADVRRWWRFPPVGRPLPVRPEDLPPGAQAALAEIESPVPERNFGERR